MARDQAKVTDSSGVGGLVQHRDRLRQATAFLGDAPRVVRASAAEYTVTDPASGQPIATVPTTAPDTVPDIAMRGSRAGSAWAAYPIQQRAAILAEAARRITADADLLAMLISAESGKSLPDARAEVAYGAGFLGWFADRASDQLGRSGTLPADGAEFMVRHRPVGLTVAITPWNFPLAMVTRKLAPALAAGCPMVLKPSELTPLTAVWLAQTLHDCGVPPDVFQVIVSEQPGDVIEPLLTSPVTRKLTFTGSTTVGVLLGQLAAQRVLRVSLELGGNAPFIVCADADLDEAVQGAVIAKFRNAGQACTAANRFYVHHSVAEEFVAKFHTAAAALRRGFPLADGTTLGVLISDRQRRRLAELVDQAVTAHPTTEHTPCGSGTVPTDLPDLSYPATLVTNTPADAPLLATELFGPVAPIVEYPDDEQALWWANDTNAGLVSYVYTESARRQAWWVAGLDTGMVGVNSGLVSSPAAPFGGVKMSGVGREGGLEGMLEYLEPQYVRYGA